MLSKAYLAMAVVITGSDAPDAGAPPLDEPIVVLSRTARPGDGAPTLELDGKRVEWSEVHDGRWVLETTARGLKKVRVFQRREDCAKHGECALEFWMVFAPNVRVAINEYELDVERQPEGARCLRAERSPTDDKRSWRLCQGSTTLSSKRWLRLSMQGCVFDPGHSVPIYVIDQEGPGPFVEFAPTAPGGYELRVVNKVPVLSFDPKQQCTDAAQEPLRRMDIRPY